MSANEWDDNADDSELVKDLRKQIRNRDKRIAEQAEELTGFKTKSRQATLSDAFKARSVPAEVSDLYPKDADTSEEAVNAWLDKYGSLFGAGKSAPADETPAPEPDAAAGGVTPEVQAQFQQLQNAEHGALTTDKAATISQALQSAQSVDDVLAAIRA